MVLPQRKSNRLTGFDYSQNGAYFVTLCTKNNKHFFGEIPGSTPGTSEACLQLSPIGRTTEDEIKNISDIYEQIAIDKHVVMPNHIHMIILILSGISQHTPTLSRIVQQFKGAVTKRIGFSIWQKSFYDRIIRNEKEYLKIWEYIDTNPAKWKEDRYYGSI